MAKELDSLLPDLDLSVLAVNFLFNSFICLLHINLGLADFAYEHHAELLAVITLQLVVQIDRWERKPLHLAVLAACSEAQVTHMGL